MSILQVIINSIIRGSELSLLAIGLTMAFDLLKFINFAHVEYAVAGVYLAYIFNVTLGINIFASIFFSAILTGAIAICLDQLVFRKMRHRNTVILMVTSFGVAIALRNTIRAIWGPAPLSYTISLQKPLIFLGIRITPVQIWIIATAAILMVSFHLLLHKTKLGKAMRAVSDNPTMAQASGITTEHIILWVWIIAGFFAAVGGILIGLETYIVPLMGFSIIIPVVCAVILGGIGNPYGAMLGALALGFAENFGLYLNFGYFISLGGLLSSVPEIQIPTGYRDVISFSILVLILFIKPSGILGRKG